MTVTVLDRALVAGDAGGVTGERQERPDPEVPEKARRRTFTAQYKLDVVMLLCLSRGSCDISWSHFGVLEKDVELAVCWVADKTGMGVRDGTQALIRSRQQQVRGEAGDGRRIVRRPAGSRQPIIGSGRPRSFRALAAGRAEVAVYLAGDVTLQAADDLRLGFPFGGAALGVGAGGRVRAQPGEHDPPQGVVGLAVTAGVEPVAGDFPR